MTDTSKCNKRLNRKQSCVVISDISLEKIFMLYFMLVHLGFIETCFVFKLHLVRDVRDSVNQFCFARLIGPNGNSEDSHGFEYQTYSFVKEDSTVLCQLKLVVIAEHVAQRKWLYQ